MEDHEARAVMPSHYGMDPDVRDNITAHLPKGRWKKHYRHSVTWYERART